MIQKNDRNIILLKMMNNIDVVEYYHDYGK